MIMDVESIKPLFKMLNTQELAEMVLKFQYTERFSDLVKQYANKLATMTEPDKEAFHARLYTMAKREYIPYGDQFIHRVNQQIHRINSM